MYNTKLITNIQWINIRETSLNPTEKNSYPLPGLIKYYAKANKRSLTLFWIIEW